MVKKCTQYEAGNTEESMEEVEEGEKGHPGLCTHPPDLRATDATKGKRSAMHRNHEIKTIASGILAVVKEHNNPQNNHPTASKRLGFNPPYNKRSRRGGTSAAQRLYSRTLA